MSDDGRRRLRCLTLTRLWTFARYVYSVGDVRLWVPVSHRMAGWAVGITVPLWAVLAVLGVPLQKLGLTAYLVVPLLLTWQALRLVGDGARPREVVWSWARVPWVVGRGQPRRSRRVRARFAGAATVPVGVSARVPAVVRVVVVGRR